MISAVRRTQLFEEHQIPVGDRQTLHAKVMLPKPPAIPKRLVFIAPLVGASASQALIMFRKLTRRGSAIVSFEYRGHPLSSGTFELDQTIVDTRHAIAWASEYARKHALPMHGFATCFGTVPLLAQYTGSAALPLFRSLCTVSGLLRLNQILRFEDFAPRLGHKTGRVLDRSALLSGLADGTVDPSSAGFRAAMQEYLGTTFPELRVGADRFEELHYDRVDIATTIMQLAHAGYLDNVSVPPDIPCTFFVGRQDQLLGLDTESGRAAYRVRLFSIVPHAEIRECEFDHFGRGPDHDTTLNAIGELFEKSECNSQRGRLAETAISIQGAKS